MLNLQKKVTTDDQSQSMTREKVIYQSEIGATVKGSSVRPEFDPLILNNK